MKRSVKVHIPLLLYILFTGCENEPPEKIGEINCFANAEVTEALGGSMIFRRGYIHLNRIEVSGTKNGSTKSASTSFEIPEQFFFIGDDPRQPVKVPIAEATYDTPRVGLYFYRDPHVLQLRDSIYDSPPEDDNDDGEDSDDDGDDNDNEEGDDDGSDDGDEDHGNDDDDDDEDGDDDDDEGNDEDNEDDNDEGDNENDDNDGDEDDNDQDDDSGNDDDNDEDNDDDDRASKVKNKTVDLSDFIQNAKPSLVLIGDYQTGGMNIMVLAAIDIDVLNLSPLLQSPLIVKKESDISATVTFQPGLWFESATRSGIEKAALINFRGETVLFIHKDFNKTLHDQILSSIEGSSQLSFEINNSL